MKKRYYGVSLEELNLSFIEGGHMSEDGHFFKLTDEDKELMISFSKASKELFGNTLHGVELNIEGDLELWRDIERRIRVKIARPGG